MSRRQSQQKKQKQQKLMKKKKKTSSYCVPSLARPVEYRPFSAKKTAPLRVAPISIPFVWSPMAITRRSSRLNHLWWVAPLLILIICTTVTESMSIPLREVILQWSEIPSQSLNAYQRPSRSFNMGPDVVHEKPRPLRFG